MMEQIRQQPPAPITQGQPQVVQRTCACGGPPGPDGECAACKAKRLSLQRNAARPAAPPAVPPIVHDVLRSPGQPLDQATRAFMEPRFGHDFSRVRVHTDSKAAASARAVNARAYTVGQNIVFGVDQHAPEKTEGRQLIAHELAHTVQQRAGDRPAPGLEISDPMDALEREARQTSDAVMGDAPAGNLSQSAPVSVARQAPSGAAPCPHPGNTRTVALQPVLFKSDPADRAPTGHTWWRRIGPANRIWGKLGVNFTRMQPVVIVDATRKVAGGTNPSALDVTTTHSGSGVEVFFVDNQMTWAGGGATFGFPGAGSKIVMSDHGRNHNLLAHELGHVLGIGHPPGDPALPGLATADANTVMSGTGSNDRGNNSRNTMVNYNHISWPPPGASTCLHPDP